MADEYAVGAVLGEGLIGPRLAGRYRPTGHPVALEEIPGSLAARSDFVERLAAAGRQAASITAPHVVEVYDLVRLGGRLYVVGELIRGRSLAALLGAEAPLPLPAALSATDSVLAALEELHRAGLVHGDVCPDTVVVTPSGDTRLAELGVATVLAADPELRGWPAVRPPEGGAPSVAADLYAAGALLRELATGLRPEQSGEWAGPVAVGSLAARAVAADPGRRPASAAEFREELQRAAAAVLGDGWREQSDLAARVARPLGTAPPRPRRPSPPPAEGSVTAATAPSPGGAEESVPPGSWTAAPAAPGVPPPAPRGRDESDYWGGIRGLGGERPTAPLRWAPARRPRQRRTGAVLAIVAALAVLAVAVVLVIQPGGAASSGPAALSVGSPTLSAQPAGAGGCGTTFTFTASGSLRGSGTLTYRWLVTETGSPTTYDQYSLPITHQTSFRFTKQLGFTGPASIGMTVTFEVLSPQRRTATATRRYVCTS